MIAEYPFGAMMHSGCIILGCFVPYVNYFYNSTPMARASNNVTYTT